MSHPTPLIPRQPVPDLDLPTAAGGRWRLREQQPEHFTLLVFYRGLHCPICAKQLRDLHARLADFRERGVNVVAVSSDDRERAERTLEEWRLDGLDLAYGLSPERARAWGLFLSRGRGTTSTGVEEPELFSEPALYLVRPDRTLYFGSSQTMPFARPDFRSILGAVDYVLANDYPARGEVTELQPAAV